MFTQRKPPRAENGRKRWLPCAGDGKQKKERPEKRTLLLFLCPEVTEGRARTSRGLPYRFIGETAAEHLPSPFFALPARARRRGQNRVFLPEYAGGAAENGPFFRNTQAVRSKRFLPPETCGGAVKSELFSRNTQASHPETSLLPNPTQRIEWKRTLSRLRRAACAAGSFFARAPSVGGASSIGGAPFIGGAACLGGFFSQERRVFHVKQAGKMARTAFSRVNRAL